MSSSGVQHSAALVCVVGSARVALPLETVIEVMRPLPIETIGAAEARGVLGISVIRGVPTVVVDGTTVIGQPAAVPARFVTLRTGDRVVALAVQDVIGVQKLGEPHALPPLLRDADTRVLDQIAARDTALLAVLETSRLLPG